MIEEILSQMRLRINFGKRVPVKNPTLEEVLKSYLREKSDFEKSIRLVPARLPSFGSAEFLKPVKPLKEIDIDLNFYNLKIKDDNV